jgi:phosphoglycerate dehydrogenase-like enzyme
VLSIHLVLSDRSRHSVNTQELSWMKPESILVNTARGPIVNEAALVEALVQRRIGAAGLDVFEQEPLPVGHPLRGLDNVVLTPHVGYVTRDSLANFHRATVEGLRAYFAGAPLKLLNPEAAGANMA